MSASPKKVKRPDPIQSTPDKALYTYMNGFQGHFSTEAVKGALPSVGNTPQQCPYGLYAEQINGTSFTKVKHANLRTWWYRIRPSAGHSRYQKVDKSAEKFPVCLEPNQANVEQLRWSPLPMPTKKTTFVEGMVTYCGAGDPSMKAGLRCILYACNADMVNQAYCSSDGDMLILPEHGTLDITTECGKLEVPHGFLVVIPRGIRFSVNVPASGARGYICEVFDNHFELPPMGVIGANGLSNSRDFETPVAWYEDRKVKFQCFQKYCGEMFTYEQDHSPFDVVAWHGNYAPYRYDLAKYCAINTVTYDHLDPSIFCVLTSQTGEAGVASCDFVIFPPRWMVAEKTFRPPYYHKNTMSEFMGNLRGVYEAKIDGGFRPGGATLHSCMAAHGPEAQVHDKASKVDLEPTPPNYDHLAFMFESTYIMKLTSYAASNNVDENYYKCWHGLESHFTPPKE